MRDFCPGAAPIVMQSLTLLQTYFDKVRTWRPNLLATRTWTTWKASPCKCHKIPLPPSTLLVVAHELLLLLGRRLAHVVLAFKLCSLGRPLRIPILLLCFRMTLPLCFTALILQTEPLIGSVGLCRRSRLLGRLVAFGLSQFCFARLLLPVPLILLLPTLIYREE